jgi:GT2 family glycosyltransferase
MIPQSQTRHVAHKSDVPQRSEAEHRAYFDAVLDRTRRAAARAGTIEYEFAIAGVAIRLVFAGDILARLFIPALQHQPRPAAGRAPDMTVHVWDSASTGTEMVPPPCLHDCFTERGDIWGMASERTRIAYHYSEYALTLVQFDTRIGIYWVQDIDCVPYWAKASPLRTLLHWILQAHGCHLLHAAAVGTEQGAVLITGKGGIGKSTTALACLAAGMRYVGDDYLAVRLQPEPVAISLYGTAKLRHGQVERLPSLRAALANAGEPDAEKAVLQLYPRHADRIALELKLRAILTPEITGDPATTVAPIDPLLLQQAASFTTISQLPHAGRQSHDYIARLVAALPGARLRLGTDLAALPGVIAGLCDDPGRIPGPMAAATAAAPRRPSISVVIPVFNACEFIAEAVGSVLAQRNPAVEIIVVDDGSTDALDAAVRALPADIRLFRLTTNKGPAAARNVGLKNAHGELVAFLDADDLWPEGSLAALTDALLADPAQAVVHGHAQLFRRGDAADGIEYLGNPEESFASYLGAGLYRREVFSRVGLFDEDLRYSEDVDWYNRADETGIGVARLAIVTLLVRRHAGNMTRGKSLVELNHLRVFKKLLDRKRNYEQIVAGTPSP